ncbi:hypothetical protein DL767_010681 [Monosporascus sp. MG133]|nr:hypothetical protein DL767_010681 [Monosporascus sp. MG133]
MCRWGDRLFGVDHDMGIALGVIQGFCKGDDVTWMINDTIKDAPQAVTQFFELEYQLTPTSNKCTQIPQKLDSGSGEQVLKKYRLDEGGQLCG